MGRIGQIGPIGPREEKTRPPFQVLSVLSVLSVLWLDCLCPLALGDGALTTYARETALAGARGGLLPWYERCAMGGDEGP